MTPMFKTSLSLAISTLALAAAAPALATEAYFLAGNGATQTSLAGAGVAYSTDASSQTLNPSGIAELDRQVQIGLSLFAPNRGYSATGTQFVTPGSYTSGLPLYPLPNVAYVSPLDASSAWGVAVYGNGGLSTQYKGVGTNGVFQGGTTGVGVIQAFVQLDYAKSFGNLSIGVAPVLAVQQFSAQGFGAFGQFGYSADKNNLTNNGVDYSVGIGLHAGLTWKATSAFRIGLSGATPEATTNFSKYKGLFANQGNFDIPGWVDAGVAYDVAPSVTLLADVKRIFYAGVGSIADSSQAAGLFGSTGGPGFGWRNVDVLALGAEWRASPQWTWRAGVEVNTNPIRPRDVTLNIVAPGVTTSEVSGGLSYKYAKNASIDFAAYYAPKNVVSGQEAVGGVNPNSHIREWLSEAQATVQWTYHFDSDAHPVGKAAY